VLIQLSSSNNTIGGTTAAAGNVISGNTANGVAISGGGTTANLVEGNTIGLMSNPVSNGGFETGDFTGWTLATSNQGGGTHVRTTFDFANVHYPTHGGTYDAAFGNPFHLDTITQTLATVPGTTYVLSY
jgi:hypothetical protein